MAKYKREYKVVVNLRSYKTDKDKYDYGETVKIKELDNISFREVLDDLNKRLINMDFLGTNLELSIEEDDARTIIDSYPMDDLVEKINLPGLLTVEINPVKVSEEEVNDFNVGVLEIIKAPDSKVLAIAYVKDRKGNLKLIEEDKKHDNTIVIEFVVTRLKEI